jgi:DNA-binding NarL/FixJ family response regulator
VIRELALARRSAPPPELDDLTEREFEIVRLVARGLPNAEIAGELCISDPTFETQVTNILRKLDLPHFVQAVVLARRTGLLEEA